MNVYVCIIYTGSQASIVLQTSITEKRSLIHFVFRTRYRTKYIGRQVNSICSSLLISDLHFYRLKIL